MRGKGKCGAVICPVAGITPAYAGKRPALSAALSQGWDHPRLCGEKFYQTAVCSVVKGSPPPMRGKGGLLSGGSATERITPAYAGKSAVSLRCGCLWWDHPRLCGEKAPAGGLLLWCLGSPPPMRGKGIAQSVQPQFFRITPAYAGKSAVSLRCGCLWWDHPRLCGEKFSNCDEKTTCVGSPPPMRGKVALFSAGMCLIRITPAYAGKSRCTGSSRGNCWDHPRLCGEKRELMSKSAAIAGSPPPMRGRGPLLVCSLHTSRITPAYAGKSHLIQIIMM